MADAKIIEPYRNFKFIVNVGGFVAGGFAKVSGLKMTTEVFEYREGGMNTTVHKLPGQTKFEPVVLERGSTSNPDMWAWASEVFTFKSAGFLNPARRTITISLIGKDKDTILRTWSLNNCWCSEWEVGELDAKSNDVLIERIVIQHEGIEEVGTAKPDDGVTV